MHRIGYIDFNHYFQISKCNVPSGKTKYSNYLNAGSIELINNYYKRDFELFGLRLFMKTNGSLYWLLYFHRRFEQLIQHFIISEIESYILVAFYFFQYVPLLESFFVVSYFSNLFQYIHDKTGNLYHKYNQMMPI